MAGQVMQLGLLRAAPVSVVLDEVRRAAELTQNQPFISSLSAHVRGAWVSARTAKQMTIEARMLENLRARRGEYDPDKLSKIREQGGAEIFMGITSAKCNSAAAWLRDVMLGSGSEKPWTIRPTPMPDLPPEITDGLVEAATLPIMEAMAAGQPMTREQVLTMMRNMKAQMLEKVRDEARARCERMEAKMEDQLVEGGFLQALDAFIDDITTFPCAILKGPVKLRSHPTLDCLRPPLTSLPLASRSLSRASSVKPARA